MLHSGFECRFKDWVLFFVAVQMLHKLRSCSACRKLETLFMPYHGTKLATASACCCIIMRPSAVQQQQQSAMKLSCAAALRGWQYSSGEAGWWAVLCSSVLIRVHSALSYWQHAFVYHCK